MSDAGEPLGLYVHVPFCEVKCSYCHFAIDPGRAPETRQERYVAALLREIEAAPAGHADTIYFGGGTPSLLRRPLFARVLRALIARFRVAPGAEITLEANPRDLDAAGYAAVASLGVNRLSLGIQSFDDAVLREMGRLHGAEDARQAFAWARDAGFSSVSIDLILGWPGETDGRWRRNLDEVAALQPDHVSWWPFVRVMAPIRWRSSVRSSGDAFKARLLELTSDRLRLTERGVLLSNEVFQALV